MTGSSGNVGRALVAALLEAGDPVRATVRPGAPTPEPDRDVVTFDFEEPTTWGAALDGVDRVFLMRPPAISDTKRVIRPFVHQLARRGVRQVVVLSVMGVNPAMPHWRVEQDVKASGVPWTSLRPAFFMQNLETAYRDDIREHDRIRQPAGHGTMSFVDARDVADVAARALLDPATYAGRALTLTGGEALGYADVASILSATLGRPIRYEPIGLRQARKELLAAGLPTAYVNVQLVINATTRMGLASKRTDDVRQVLGRPPRTVPAYVEDRRELWER